MADRIPTGTEDDLHTILRDEYACTRVWEAWQVGTMTQDDFTPMGETEIVGDLIEWRNAAVKAALAEVERIPRCGATTPHAFEDWGPLGPCILAHGHPGMHEEGAPAGFPLSPGARWTEHDRVGEQSPTDQAALGAWLRALPRRTILRDRTGDPAQTDTGVEHRHRQPNREFPALFLLGDPFEITEGHPQIGDLTRYAPFTVLALGNESEA